MLLLIQKYKYARIKNAQMQHILKILKAFSPWRLKKKSHFWDSFFFYIYRDGTFLSKKKTLSSFVGGAAGGVNKKSLTL